MATTLFKYDANDNPTNVVENGLTNAWTYDTYDHVSSYKDVFGNLIQYKYDLNGNITNLVYPGGKNVYYRYDSNNHMTNVTDWSGRISSISYDLAGQVTSITRPNGTVRTIGYDAAGQTTNITEKAANGNIISYYKLGWDNAARMATEYGAPLPHTATVPTRTMTFDDDNRLTGVDGNTIINDADGNMTSGPLTNDTLFAYTYDGRNRLLNVGGVTNAYDAAGNRVGIAYGTNSVAYVVNPNSKLSQVLMRIKNGTTNYYIYGAGLLYQITESATVTNTLTYHYDYRGSTVALTDGTGTNITDRIEYSAYATTTYRSGTNDTPFLFNGRYGVMTDPNGLLYMRARYYSPYLCRFINPDPSGFSGGLNFYAYAGGNPVSYLDPFGLVSWELLGRSAFGFVANSALAVGGALLAETGVGAVGAAYGAYQAGANFGNIINALSDTPAGPTAPLQTGANLIFPNNKTANNLGQAGDLIVGLATGNALGSESEIASAAGLVTAAQYDNATLNFANQLSTVYLGATHVDAGLTTYDAWSWALPSSPSSPLFSNPASLPPNPLTSSFSNPSTSIFSSPTTSLSNPTK